VPYNRKRVFLESEAFGREYFDPPADGDLTAQVARLIASAQARGDGVTRRVGIELSADEEGPDGPHPA
jgi:hypothetical protein